MLNRLLFIIFLAFGAGLNSSLAQDLFVRSKRLSLEEGLSSRWIYHSYQGPYGFVWMTNEFGLNRFDGYEVKTINKKEHGLTSNETRYLFFTPDSMVAVLNQPFRGKIRSIDILHPLTLQVCKWEDYINAPFEVQDIHRVITNKQHTNIIMTYAGDMYHFSKEGLTKRFTIDTSNKHHHFYLTADQNLWSFRKMDTQTRVDVHSEWGQLLDTFNLPLDIRLLTISDFNENALYISFKQGSQIKYAIKHLHQPIRFLPISPERTWQTHSIYSTFHELIFLKDGPSLVAYDTAGTIIFEDDQFYRKYKFSTLQEFRNGQLWFCSTDDGALNVLVEKKYPFKTVLKDFYIKERLFGSRNMIDLNNEEILVCGSTGIYVIDKTSWTFGRWDASLPSFAYTKAEQLGLLKDHNHAIWTSSEFNYLNYISSDQRHTQLYRYKNAGDNDPLMQWVLFEDKNHTIWVGNNNGISIIDTAKGVLVEYEDYGSFDQLKNSTVYFFYENNYGIWVASSTGLYLLDPQKGVSDFHPLPADVIAHIHEDTDSIFWIASKGGGLIAYDYRKKIAKQYTTDQGLSNNVTYATLEDDQNNLWVSSNFGLMQINKATFNIKTYLEKDGIANNEFNTGSYLKSKDGWMLFGGINGISAFRPADIQLQQQKVKRPQLIVTQLEKRDESSGTYTSHLTELLENRSIQLSTAEKVIRLKLALLNFNPTEQNRYQYKIEGFDKNWTLISGNTIRLNNLPYGKNVLRIRAFSLGNEKEIAELSIPINVAWPIYLTTGFIGILLLCNLFLIYLFILLRTRQLKSRQLELEEKVELRTMEIREQNKKIQRQSEALQKNNQLKDQLFTNISHELRTPLTLILGPLSKILESTDYIDPALLKQLTIMQKNGQNLKLIIDEILDLAKIDAGKMVIQNRVTTCHEFFKQIFNNFEPMARSKQIDFNLTINAAASITVMMDQKKVEKILNNLLSNALKFTDIGDEVHLSVKGYANHLDIFVTDSGPGISEEDLPHVFKRFYQVINKNAEKGGTGIGLSLSKELALLLGGDLKLSSSPGNGVNCHFSLPIEPLASQLPPTIIQINNEPTVDVLSSSTPRKMQLLLVEDNLDMQEFITNILSDQYHVKVRNNGLEAWHSLQTDFAPDLIISDIMMPEMDGFELVEKIRQQEQMRLIPIIMLTAKSLENDKLFALNLGVNDYLTKPFSVKEFEVRVQNLIQNKLAREQWVEQQRAKLYSEKTALDYKSAVLSDSTDHFVIEKENPTTLETDGNWMIEVNQVIENNYTSQQFDSSKLASELLLSKRQLERKLKLNSGLTPAKYIQTYRLKKAYMILESGQFDRISDVCYHVGFGTTSHFSKVFSKEFGKKPSEFKH